MGKISQRNKSKVYKSTGYALEDKKELEKDLKKLREEYLGSSFIMVRRDFSDINPIVRKKFHVGKIQYEIKTKPRKNANENKGQHIYHVR